MEEKEMFNEKKKKVETGAERYLTLNNMLPIRNESNKIEIQMACACDIFYQT